MNTSKVKTRGILAVAAIWLILTAVAWLRPSDDFSVSERRQLAQFPKLNVQTVMDGKFMTNFEDYTLDQFPMRNIFRQWKALFHYNVMGQLDNNDIYLEDGYAAKLEYPLDEQSISHAADKFRYIYEKYLREQGSTVFLSIVPDKGYFLAERNGYPSMDYEQLAQQLTGQMPFASYVNLFDTLKLDDYYRTDTHWRQENLLDAAARLCGALGIQTPDPSEYTVQGEEKAFYGVYYGQAALPMEPETLYTLRSELLSDCRVFNYETGKYAPVYDDSKLTGEDLYEVYLSGPVSLLTIENPHATTDRELIIFRDSFGSAIAPLLVQGYKTVTLVDIRYLSSAMLDRFVDFHGQDVLFLYSTLVLNNSETFQ